MRSSAPDRCTGVNCRASEERSLDRPTGPDFAAPFMREEKPADPSAT
jgi:hypothetical protein